MNRKQRKANARAAFFDTPERSSRLFATETEIETAQNYTGRRQVPVIVVAGAAVTAALRRRYENCNAAQPPSRPPTKPLARADDESFVDRYIELLANISIFVHYCKTHLVWADCYTLLSCCCSATFRYR